VSLQRGRIDIRSVINNALEAAAPLLQERGHRLKVNLPEQSIPVFGDAARLQQVIGNLATNAFKYTRRGGEIFVDASQDDGELTIRIADNGVGIKEDLLPHIFDLFVQGDQSLDRTQGGLGIGLTLVRQLVEMHGGRVEAHSEGPDKGSEFVVHLPVMPAERRPQDNAPQAKPKAATKRRILIVDDNLDFAASMKLLLQTQHHEVEIAQDGLAAIETAKAFNPDIVLLDLGLPGLNGYETAQRLRAMQELRDVRLIAVSGYAQEEDRQRSQRAGFDTHLKKPVDFHHILEVIESS
jgi:CheY-like chemotaxis protein/two-component sensor histidine kinase